MNAAEYRKKYLEELEKDAEKPMGFPFESLNESNSIEEGLQTFSFSLESLNEDEVSKLVRVVLKKDEDLKVRSAAIKALAPAVGKREDLIDLMLEILRDKTEHQNLRIEALSNLQQSTFSPVIFRPKRAEYLETLRALIDEEDDELRRRVVEILAIEKDSYVQERLIEGLNNSSAAIVEPEKAVQLLGLDIHAENFPILRQIVNNPPNQAAKNEAVRVLAAYADSRNLLAEILQDKSEAPEIRKTSAVALQSAAPGEFKEQARQIVFDDDDDDDVRAACLNALEHSSDSPDFAEALSDDSDFLEKVEQLKETTVSKDLEKVADRYLSKHRK